MVHDHYQSSVGALAAAETYRLALDEEYAKPQTERNVARIASLHQRIGYALKAAGVHATLATVLGREL